MSPQRLKGIAGWKAADCVFAAIVFIVHRDGNAIRVLETDFSGCGGPQPPAGEQIPGLQLRDPDLNPCCSHDHVFTMTQPLCAHRLLRKQLANSHIPR